jgi:hypothetical protein
MDISSDEVAMPSTNHGRKSGVDERLAVIQAVRLAN